MGDPSPLHFISVSSAWRICSDRTPW